MPIPLGELDPNALLSINDCHDSTIKLCAIESPFCQICFLYTHLLSNLPLAFRLASNMAKPFTQQIEVRNEILMKLHEKRKHAFPTR